MKIYVLASILAGLSGSAFADYKSDAEVIRAFLKVAARAPLTLEIDEDNVRSEIEPFYGTTVLGAFTRAMLIHKNSTRIVVLCDPSIEFSKVAGAKRCVIGFQGSKHAVEFKFDWVNEKSGNVLIPRVLGNKVVISDQGGEAE